MGATRLLFLYLDSAYRGVCIMLSYYMCTFYVLFSMHILNIFKANNNNRGSKGFGAGEPVHLIRGLTLNLMIMTEMPGSLRRRY